MSLFEPTASWKPTSEWRNLNQAPDTSILPYFGHYVYIIARPEKNGWKTAARIGQTADLEGRLSSHSGRPPIRGATYGKAKVKWSRIARQHIDGVERYLYESLTPMLGERVPEAEPKEIDLPPRVTSP